MSRLALFVPCFIDQLYPRTAIAALQVLERLGIDVDVPEGAACCGQPPANAGFERDAAAAMTRFTRTYASYDRTIVLSGSCAVHLRAHAGAHTVEFCEFLHDEVGAARVAQLGVAFPARAALHIGCHALRGLGLASPSELQGPRFNKVRALLEMVEGLTFVEPSRRDECCGFGGTFAVDEPAISAKIGRDRLQDYLSQQAELIISTDMSCLMHLGGLARRGGLALPMVHVAEVLAGVVAC